MTERDSVNRRLADLHAERVSTNIRNPGSLRDRPGRCATPRLRPQASCQYTKTRFKSDLLPRN
jgi:hypothetical protein